MSLAARRKFTDTQAEAAPAGISYGSFGPLFVTISYRTGLGDRRRTLTVILLMEIVVLGTALVAYIVGLVMMFLSR